MEILAFSMNATLPVVLCMAAGFLMRLLGKLDDHTISKLSDVCFVLFLPSLLFSSVHSIDFHANFSPSLLLYAFLGVIILVVILPPLYMALTKDLKKAVAWAQVSYRSNYLMFGIALVQNMFGAEGVQVASMLVPVAVITFNFVTVVLFSIADVQRDQPLPKKLLHTVANIFRNPLIIGALLALIVVFAEIPLPSWALSTVNSIGSVSSPLCLVIMGAQIDLKSLRRNAASVVSITAVRLVLIPLVGMIPAVMMGFRGAELGSLFILFASPCANSCIIMSQRYDVYPKFTAQVVMMTTAFSGLTIFLGITLLRYLQLF